MSIRLTLPLDKALAIAAAGVSVDWLATGDGVHAAAEVRASYGASRNVVAMAKLRHSMTDCLKGS